MAQQYEYSGFERHESVPELPEDERIIYNLPVAKKHRKGPRKGNKVASMIQPPQQPRVQDRIAILGAAKCHIPGHPILPKAAVEAIYGDLRRLHDDVLRREKSLIASENPGYPLYVVNVPRQRFYVDIFPAENFFLRFDYIFDTFHLKKLDFTFVRLFALYMNYIIGIEQIPYICVADPYFMHEGFLAVCPEHREGLHRDFMVANKDKETILVPYHPIHGSAVLIILYPRFSHALCLDSSKNMNKRITPTSSLFLTVLSLSTAYGVERSRPGRQGTAGPPSAIIPTSAASSNRVVLLVMDSMSYTTCWSTDRISRTFACHLHPVMPIFCNG